MQNTGVGPNDISDDKTLLGYAQLTITAMETGPAPDAATSVAQQTFQTRRLLHTYPLMEPINY